MEIFSEYPDSPVPDNYLDLQWLVITTEPRTDNKHVEFQN